MKDNVMLMQRKLKISVRREENRRRQSDIKKGGENVERLWCV